MSRRQYIPDISKIQPPAVTRLFMMEFLSCLICTSPRGTELGCVPVWKIVGGVCSGVKQEDFRRHSANLSDPCNEISNFTGEDRNETDKSDVNSLVPHEKAGDEDTNCGCGTKSTMSWLFRWSLLRPGSLAKKIGPLKGTLNKIEQAWNGGTGTRTKFSGQNGVSEEPKFCRLPLH